jgi:hypothetical protein
MIAYDGQHVPTNIKLNRETKQQIRVEGAALINADGRLITIFKHDLPMLENANYKPKAETSACA